MAFRARACRRFACWEHRGYRLSCCMSEVCKDAVRRANCQAILKPAKSYSPAKPDVLSATWSREREDSSDLTCATMRPQNLSKRFGTQYFILKPRRTQRRKQWS